MELLKQSTWSETMPKLFFWRTASGREVDTVLEDNAGRIVGIEVKAAATLNTNDVGGLVALAEEVGKKWIRGIVLYTGFDLIPFGSNLHGIPLQALWQPGKSLKSPRIFRLAFQNSCAKIAATIPD